MPTGVDYKPSDKDRVQVKVMALCGLSNRSMALIMKISENTLRKHYKEDIENGKAEMIAMCGKKALEIALSGDKDMLKFLLNSKGGFHQTSEVTENRNLRPVIRIIEQKGDEQKVIEQIDLNPRPVTKDEVIN